MATAYVGRPREMTIRLYANTGYDIMPLPGILYNEVDVKVKKEGGVLRDRALLEAEWVDQGAGFYTIRLSGSDLDTLGEFMIYVTDPEFLFQDVVASFDILPTPFYTQNTSPLCIITGNLVDMGGMPGSGEQIVFQILKVPVTSGDSFVTGSSLRTYADALGNFSISLLRGIRALVIQENCGIRNVITVPDAPTASIVDLLPPVPPAPLS